MAGSYRHVVTTGSGRLRSNESFAQSIETVGDAYEAVEEMYGMIWWLAKGDSNLVEAARQEYVAGLDRFSPGVQQ